MLIIPDNIWNEIKNVIPSKETKVDRPQKDPRIVLSGIWYIMMTGAQWHNLPSCYGKPTTVHGRFRIWVSKGVFAKILQESIKAAVSVLGEPLAFLADTSFAKAPLALFSGRNPTDRSKRGVKISSYFYHSILLQEDSLRDNL